MPATATKLYTAEEYASLPDSLASRYSELVRGEVVEMAQPGWRHGEVQVNISSLLKEYARTNRNCRVATESGVKTETDPDTVRGPDVIVYTTDRMPLNKVVVKYHDQPADLCVEVRSRDDSVRELTEKVEEYLRSGVRLVWVADPEDQTVTVFANGSPSRSLAVSDIIDAEPVLPGFTANVADFFD